MQMSPLLLFCEHCGAANTTTVTACFACKTPLQFSPSASMVQTSAPPAAPASTIAISTSTPSGHLVTGSLLNGRYQIENQLGQGGFSIVYAAKDQQHKHKRVAIKQISLRSLTPRQVIEATDTYNREIGLLSRLKHRGLPHIYDHFTDQDHWYLVMDYIEGETLEDYMSKTRQGYLPLPEVLTIGIQLCKVLNLLHSQESPIIFRDVKPSNMMRTSKGRLYLIDFGIARSFTPGKSKDTGPLGSPGYAAPEQYGTAQTTAQTDIYSLGVTLQSLLTGQDPLDTTTAASAGQPVPRKLRQLLDRMLEKDPGKRPASVKEVEIQLTHIKRGIIGPLLSFLGGLLQASLPFPFIVLLAFCLRQFPQIPHIFPLNAVVLAFYFVFICISPFAIIKHFINAIRFLRTPVRRAWGLGMLTMLLLLVLLLIGFLLIFMHIIALFMYIIAH